MRTGLRYRTTFFAVMALLALLPAMSSAAQFQLKSDTIFRLYERDTVKGEDEAVLPGYEYLQVDAGQLDDYGFSFHLYGWGRADFADNDYFQDQTAGEILYGYLEYRQKAARFSARLGRQYVFEGVANEAVDGLRLNSDLGEYFSLSLYGGQPVGLDSENGRSGDSIYGGRLAHRLGPYYEVGVSYKTIDNDNETTQELLGIDLSAVGLGLYGKSTYNVDTEEWAEHFYELRIPVGDVQIRPYFEQFAYDDYFSAGASTVGPFRYLAQSEEELIAYGVDALWQIDDSWTVGGKVKLFDYDQADEAQSYSALLTWQGEGGAQVGGEVGHTAADDTAGNDYTLVRLYGYWDELAGRFWIDFISSDVLLAFYDEEIYGEDRSLFVSLGLGKRFLKNALTLTLSGDYSQDPYFDDDLRGMLTLSYAFAR